MATAFAQLPLQNGEGLMKYPEIMILPNFLKRKIRTSFEVISKVPHFKKINNVDRSTYRSKINTKY